MPVPHRPTESARQSHCREPDALVDFHTAGDVAGDWPRTAPSAARADNAALRPGAVRADVLGSGGVRSASAVVIGAGGAVRSRSNSASRPSTRDFFRRATSAAIESILLLSELMASNISSFVADSRRRRRVQLCVAVLCLCSGLRLRGAKLWATACSKATRVNSFIFCTGAFNHYACWLVLCRRAGLAAAGLHRLKSQRL